MKARLIEWVERHSLFSKADQLLVAVSGGRDSMCLAHLLHESGYKIHIAHINYNLRGLDSKQDETLVRDFAASNNVPASFYQEDLSTFEGNVQVKARESRYAFFQDLIVKHQLHVICTAHHKQDRFETTFINLMRGTGIHGLKGIPIKQDNVVRPLLWAERSEIDLYVQKHAIPYRDDVSNDSDHYLRNRVRHHLIPLLQALDQHAAEKLNSSIENLTDDANAMSSMAQSLWIRKANCYDLLLASLPKDEGHTWVYQCLRPFGFNRIQAKDLFESTNTGKSIISNAFRAVKSKHYISLLHPFEHETLTIDTIGKHDFEWFSIILEWKQASQTQLHKANNAANLQLNEADFPLKIAEAKDQDRFQPLGLDYSVSVRKFILEKGGSYADIATAQFLKTASNQTCWLINWQIDDRFRVTDQDSKILSLYFHRNGD